MALWTLYEDNGENLFAVRRGKCVLIEHRDELPDWSSVQVSIDSVVGAREHYPVATLQGYRVVERAHDGGASAQEYLALLAARVIVA